MNIGLFGGTFDPIHRGHLALAHAARERCGLQRIYFVPTNVPPHKTAQPVASYFHRYAMTALATQNEKTFLPSLLEAPGEFILHDRKSMRGSLASGPNYSIDTIHRLKQSLEKSDRLFFLIVAGALPEKLRPRAEATKPFARQPAKGDLVLPGVTLHLLDDVNQKISATEIRKALRGKRPLKRLVPESVEEYIKKERLYA